MSWDKLYCKHNALIVRLKDDKGKRLTFDEAIEYFPYSIRRPQGDNYFMCR